MSDDLCKGVLDRLLHIAMTDGFDDAFLYIHQSDMRFICTYGLGCYDPCVDPNLLRYGYIGVLYEESRPDRYRSLYIDRSIEPGTAVVIPCTQPNVDLTRPNAVSYMPVLLEQCRIRRVHRLYATVPVRDPITAWTMLLDD